MNGRDNSELGDKLISPEVEWKPSRNKREIRTDYVQDVSVPLAMLVQTSLGLYQSPTGPGR